MPWWALCSAVLNAEVAAAWFTEASPKLHRRPAHRQADGSRTCARSEISAVHFIRWLGGAERRAGFLFAQFAGGAGRWPSYGVIGDSWPQPRQADGSRTCARSEISAVHFIRWLGGAERRAAYFFLHNSPAALAAGRATG